VLVGSPDYDVGSPSLLDPLHAFADPPDSGTYNAHGQYLTALEQRLGQEMTWLGTPGAFSHCIAHVFRTPGPALHLDFLSYAEKYLAAGLPMYWPTELQPYYPWSLAWREDDNAAATMRVREIAFRLADELGWLVPEARALAPPWMPDDDPAWQEISATAEGCRDPGSLSAAWCAWPEGQ
jgi:hypothetical protein